VDFEKGNTSKQINAAQQMKFIAAKQTPKKKRFTWRPSSESIGCNISVPKKQFSYLQIWKGENNRYVERRAFQM
jgi:hypothetical protein